MTAAKNFDIVKSPVESSVQHLSILFVNLFLLLLPPCKCSLRIVKQTEH